MMHTRGRPADYDGWAAHGAPAGRTEDVLPYLQRLEGQRDDTNPTAGRDGPITVVNAKDTGNAISQTFIDACVELGYPQLDDFNAGTFGAGWHHVDIRDGSAAACARLPGTRARPAEPDRTRPVRSVTALDFDGQRCVGVTLPPRWTVADRPGPTRGGRVAPAPSSRRNC